MYVVRIRCMWKLPSWWTCTCSNKIDINSRTVEHVCHQNQMAVGAILLMTMFFVKPAMPREYRRWPPRWPQNYKICFIHDNDSKTSGFTCLWNILTWINGAGSSQSVSKVNLPVSLKFMCTTISNLLAANLFLLN